MAVGTPTNLTAGLNVTDASSFVTAAFTPTAGAKLLAWINVGHRTITPNEPTSLTGHGVTWTMVTEVTTSNNTWNCSLWEATASGSPSSGTLTFNLGATAESATWRVIEATGAQIVQFETLPTSAANPSLTLDNAIGAGGVTVGILMNNNATTTITAGTGYTDLGSQQSTGTAPVFKGAAEYKMAGTTTVDFTASGTVVRALLGVELGPAGATNFNGTSSIGASDALASAGTVGKVASSSIAATDAVASVGVVGRAATASIATTDSLAAAGAVGSARTAGIAGTDALTGAGAVGKVATAALAAAAAVTAAGFVSTSQGADLPATASLSATGSLGVARTVTLDANAALAVTGVVGKASTTTVAGTAAATGTGSVGLAGTASLAATATVDAVGDAIAGNERDGEIHATATLTAVAQVGRAGSATRSATAAVNAAGSVTVLTGADVAAMVTIAADGTVSGVGQESTAAVTATATLLASGDVDTVGGTVPDIRVTPDRARFTSRADTATLVSLAAVSDPSRFTARANTPRHYSEG